ncbi:Phospholipase D-like domain [Trinorchestia longiramus]|nr:Phospholipase D-like domain [Trinorchestia longiramus]
MYRLQGYLEVIVVKATDLPNLDHDPKKPNDLSDPYVVAYVVGKDKNKDKLCQTPTVKDSLNPFWDYKVTAEIDHEVSEILFVVFDKDFLKSEKLGFAALPAENFHKTKGWNGDLQLTDGKQKPRGTLTVSIKFTGSTFPCTSKSQKRKTLLKINQCVKRPDKSDAAGGSEPFFAHGRMLIKIMKAENLPNMDYSVFNKKNKSDPLAIASLVDRDGAEHDVATTTCIEDNLNPEWNEEFLVNVCHEITNLVFKVYDKDLYGKDLMGSVTIPVIPLKKEKQIEGKFNLMKNDGTSGMLQLSVKLFDNEYENASLLPEVPNCVFKMKENNTVTLYQDAHCPSLPVQVTDRAGVTREPANAWQDIYNALKNAQKAIFITGWSVNAKIELVRGQNVSVQCLGEILKEKAEEGVNVRLLLWDEVLSTNNVDLSQMNTGDNETKQYFKNSKVKVALAVRKKKEYKHSQFSRSNKFTKLCYSHHQKTIITDVANKNGSQFDRHFVAFLGGLDLTSGRYDTPEHKLFSTLSEEHKEDFYNNVVKSSVENGPRQPWHDIHCQIAGPAVKDILSNFTERWEKQGFKDEKKSNLGQIYQEYTVEGKDSWNVQVFRSISTDSAAFTERLKLDKIDKLGLFKNKGIELEDSIHRAYIHQIQRSKRFIYIENQYFMGSSHLWDSCRDIEIRNLVPLEIASKIVDKINKKEEFVAYILLPMFPEGSPENGWMQAMLHWQFHTIEMMYRMIAKALEENNVDASPQDYLLFFCLGKREGSVPEHLKSPQNASAAKAFKNRRMMIYVHSKMAIFDDEYIIVGSANINDRSLKGTRDTEIAMGAFQPNVPEPSQGEVSLFRKSLWAEHLGAEVPLDLDPGTHKCAKQVRSLAEENLIRYTVIEMPLPTGHLMLYPLSVEKDGTVKPRKNVEEFPDTTAAVDGKRGIQSLIIEVTT